MFSRSGRCKYGLSSGGVVVSMVALCDGLWVISVAYGGILEVPWSAPKLFMGAGQLRVSRWRRQPLVSLLLVACWWMVGGDGGSLVSFG